MDANNTKDDSLSQKHEEHFSKSLVEERARLKLRNKTLKDIEECRTVLRWGLSYSTLSRLAEYRSCLKKNEALLRKLSTEHWSAIESYFESFDYSYPELIELASKERRLASINASEYEKLLENWSNSLRRQLLDAIKSKKIIKAEKLLDDIRRTKELDEEFYKKILGDLKKELDSIVYEIDKYASMFVMNHKLCSADVSIKLRRSLSIEDYLEFVKNGVCGKSKSVAQADFRYICEKLFKAGEYTKLRYYLDCIKEAEWVDGAACLEMSRDLCTPEIRAAVYSYRGTIPEYRNDKTIPDSGREKIAKEIKIYSDSGLIERRAALDIMEECIRYLDLEAREEKLLRNRAIEEEQRKLREANAERERQRKAQEELADQFSAQEEPEEEEPDELASTQFYWSWPSLSSVESSDSYRNKTKRARTRKAPKRTRKKDVADQIIEDHGVRSLYRFTKLSNLKSILDCGILSIDELEERGIGFKSNDLQRYDGRSDCVCVSVGFPNDKLFSAFRARSPKAKWVVLEIDSNILKKTEFHMFSTNAATNKGSTETRRVDEFFGNSSSCYPEDVQAEILISERIPERYIKRIYARDEEDIARYRKYSNKFKVNSSVFNKRGNRR